MNPSLSMTRLLRLPLTILAFLLIALPALSQAAVSIRVNAGGPTYTDGHGVTWQTDAGAGNGTTLDWGNIGIAGSADPTLYRTERYGTQLHYAFGVPNGSYRVKLHFAENYFNASWPNGGIGQRRFDVRIENAVALHDFDVLAVAGEHTVTVQTFDTTVIDGQLDIDLLAAANNALLNAIEIDDVGAPDTAAPTAPSGLQANAVNAFTIALTWNAATDAGTGVGGYNVYRNGVFIGVATASALGLGFTDVTAQPNTTYTYAVTATDNASPPNESIPSSPATVATPAPGSGGSALFRINAGGLSVVDGNGAVWSADSYGSFGAALNWQSMGAPDVGGTPFSAIFRTERYSPNVAAGIEMRYDLPVPNGTYDVRLYFDERWVTGPGQRHFGVSVNGNVYYVDVYAEAGGQGVPLIRTTRVTVTDGNIAIRFLRDVENPFVNGIEVVSVNDTTTPTPPGAPTALSATLEGGANVRLDWTAPTNAGRGIAGYRVWRDGAALSGATPSATTFLDQFVLYGHTYHYTVSAYDVNGLESAPSAEAVITLPGTGCPAPSQVTGVRATTITSDTISLSWNPATEPCLGVQSYMIAHEFPNSFATVGTVRGNVTTFPDSGLAPATSKSPKSRKYMYGLGLTALRPR